MTVLAHVVRSLHHLSFEPIPRWYLELELSCLTFFWEDHLNRVLVIRYSDSHVFTGV